MTNGSQPAFLAYQGTTDANETGDGTTYTLGDTDVGTTLTEAFDQNGDFTPGASGGAVFTAPVTGKYFMSFQVDYLGVDGNVHGTEIVSSNNTFRLMQMDPATTDNGGNFSPIGSLILDMDASDTVQFTCLISGGTKISDIRGTTTSQRTFVSGALIC
jgi:hypothetical protein